MLNFSIFVVQEIIRDNLDYVFIPSDTPAFIQDYIKKFINMTQVGVTGDWIAYTNNSEIPSTDGPHHFVTRKGSLAHLDLVFTIFKDLKWHFSVIFFDNTYGEKYTYYFDQRLISIAKICICRFNVGSCLISFMINVYSRIHFFFLLKLRLLTCSQDELTKSSTCIHYTTQMILLMKVIYLFCSKKCIQN